VSTDRRRLPVTVTRPPLRRDEGRWRHRDRLSIIGDHPRRRCYYTPWLPLLGLLIVRVTRRRPQALPVRLNILMLLLLVVVVAMATHRHHHVWTWWSCFRCAPTHCSVVSQVRPSVQSSKQVGLSKKTRLMIGAAWTLRCPLLPYKYSTAVKHPAAQHRVRVLAAGMSKITNNGLTQSGTGCFTAVVYPYRL